MQEDSTRDRGRPRSAEESSRGQQHSLRARPAAVVDLDSRATSCRSGPSGPTVPVWCCFPDGPGVVLLSTAHGIKASVADSGVVRPASQHAGSAGVSLPRAARRRGPGGRNPGGNLGGGKPDRPTGRALSSTTSLRWSGWLASRSASSKPGSRELPAHLTLAADHQHRCQARPARRSTREEGACGNQPRSGAAVLRRGPCCRTPSMVDAHAPVMAVLAAGSGGRAMDQAFPRLPVRRLRIPPRSARHRANLSNTPSTHSPRPGTGTRPGDWCPYSVSVIFRIPR